MGNLPSPATAEDDNNKPPAEGDAPAKDAAKVPAKDTAKDTAKPKPPSKDPVATAFALPKGTTLNAKQQAVYDQLKADKEDELRQAIDDLQKSTSGATAAAAKKIRDLRAAIRQKINDILYGKLATSGRSQQRCRQRKLWQLRRAERRLSRLLRGLSGLWRLLPLLALRL